MVDNEKPVNTKKLSTLRQDSSSTGRKKAWLIGHSIVKGINDVIE